VRDMGLQVPDDVLLSAVPELPDDPAQLAALGASTAALDLLDTANVVIVCLRHRGLHERNRVYSDRVDAVLHAARRNLTPQLGKVAASTAMQTAITRMFAEDLAGARLSFQQACDFALLDSEDEYVRRDASGKMALTYALAGDARQTALWLRRHEAAAFAADGEWFRYTVESTADCARLLLCLEQLDLASAGRLRELDGPLEPGEFWAYFAYAEALHFLHSGDAAAGARALRERPDSGIVDPGLVSGPMLAAIEADLLLALGRGNDAHAVLTGPHAAHPGLRVGRARLALLSGHDDDAAAQTHDLHWMQRATSRWQQEMTLIQAVAHLRLGQHEFALAALRRALSSAAQLDAWRAFTTVPRDELTALAAALPAEERAPLSRLAAMPDAFPRSITLVELTSREQTILEHLAAGLSRGQLAQRLYISTNTVKYHVRGLYRKLGAATRTEALARAAGLGLIGTEDDTSR